MNFPPPKLYPYFLIPNFHPIPRGITLAFSASAAAMASRDFFHLSSKSRGKETKDVENRSLFIEDARVFWDVLGALPKKLAISKLCGSLLSGMVARIIEICER